MRCAPAEAIKTVTSRSIGPHKNGRHQRKKEDTSPGDLAVPSRPSQRWNLQKPLVEGWCSTAAEPAYEPHHSRSAWSLLRG